MNKKGLTLVELIFSLALISIIMVFIFNLLGDLKTEDSLSKTRSEDSLTRSTVINLIQNDFIKLGLYRWSSCNQSGSLICISFTFKDNTTKNLHVYEDFIAYGAPGMMEKWTLQGGKFTLDNFSYCFKTTIENPKDRFDTASPNYYLKIFIPVTHDVKSKRKYDFEIMSMGKMTDIYASNPNSLVFNGQTKSSVC